MNRFDERILPIKEPVNNDTVGGYFKIFAERYPIFDYFEIGRSIRDRPIYCCRLGDAKAPVSLLYVGAHHGMEWITSALLLRFINEYCEYYGESRRMYGIGMPLLYKERSIYIVPMLNPDGVLIQENGASKESPLYHRLIAMNDGDENFIKWQANERGVDLNHNYNAGFAEYKKVERELSIFGGCRTKYSGEYPESEPETRALCGLIRTVSPSMILTLHTQGEEIYYTSGGKIPHMGKEIGRVISDMTGYTLAEPTGTAAYGGLTDWFIEEFGKPSFTIECGKGENPLPFGDFFGIYAAVREMLFVSPTLIKL